MAGKGRSRPRKTDDDLVTKRSESLGSGNSKSFELQGSGNCKGIVNRASTSYDIQLEWLDAPNGNVVETEDVATGVSAGSDTTWDKPMRTPWVNVKVSDAGNGTGAFDLAAQVE